MVSHAKAMREGSRDDVREETVVVGAGRTGMSFARYLSQRGEHYVVLDQAPNDQQREALQEIDDRAHLERISNERLIAAREILLSPGVPRSGHELQAAITSGVPVRGDLDVFAGACNTTTQVVAITGTNGKSTVTTLLGQMAAAAELSMKVGGNLGIPCLDLLDETSKGYILEVSSYQLESAGPFHADVATVLNLAPDHLDRYDSLEHYYETKASMYQRTNIAVVNRDTDYSFDLSGCGEVWSFGSRRPLDDQGFGLIGGALFQGENRLLDAHELKVRGIHNQLNVLAALAIGAALRWDMQVMLRAARRFEGLSHRCETVEERNGRVFINDSKATNPAATEVAVRGLVGQAKAICLLAGGIAKDADMRSMARSTAPHLTHVVAFGRDAEVIASAYRSEAVAVTQVDDLDQAVAAVADGSDVVLLSPGCASFDQFRNFEHRGDYFKALVHGLGGTDGD